MQLLHPTFGSNNFLLVFKLAAAAAAVACAKKMHTEKMHRKANTPPAAAADCYQANCGTQKLIMLCICAASQ